MTARNRLLALGCVLLLTLVACAPKEVPPGQRLVEAMELIRDGKPNELAAYALAADAADVGLFYGLFSSVFAEDGGLARTEILSETITADTAEVHVKFHYTNGKGDEEKLRLQREGGVWKLDL